MGQLYLAPTTIKQLSLSDECRAISDYLGVVYATVTKTGEKLRSIMYRIYQREQSLSLDCTWVETYDLGFSAMNAELTSVHLETLPKLKLWIPRCSLFGVQSFSFGIFIGVSGWALTRQVKGRTQEWVKICFADK